jgi:glucose-1-phosphate thymidylyltransferase
MTGSLKGVVLAAGIGKRLMPLTATRPKPMLPIAGRPLLEYNLEQLASAGVSEIAVVVPLQGEAIEHYFGGVWRGIPMHYIVQGEARGTGHALNLVREVVGGSAFYCIFGDNLTTWSMARLLPVHREMGAAATLALFHAPDPRRHGVAELQGRYIRRIIEKPEHPPSDLASAGMFIFEPEIFDALDAIEVTSRGELELPDAVQHLISRGRIVAYDVLDEWRININTPAQFLEANHHMLDGREPGISGAGIVPPVVAAGDPRIEANAELGPYVSCGRGCVLRRGALVVESVLLDSVTVEEGAEVRGSIIGQCARIASGVRVCDQVVADNAVCG